MAIISSPRSTLSPRPPGAVSTTLGAYSAYDIPSVEALIRFFHAISGFPVKSSWLATIKPGNYVTWPGFTFANTSNYCPSADDTIKGLLAQTMQGM